MAYGTTTQIKQIKNDPKAIIARAEISMYEVYTLLMTYSTLNFLLIIIHFYLLGQKKQNYSYYAACSEWLREMHPKNWQHHQLQIRHVDQNIDLNIAKFRPYDENQRRVYTYDIRGLEQCQLPCTSKCTRSDLFSEPVCHEEDRSKYLTRNILLGRRSNNVVRANRPAFAGSIYYILKYTSNRNTDKHIIRGRIAFYR